MESTGAPPPSYWDYLRLDALLSLQGGLDGDENRLMPDELHFVVVHQVFELWFKLCLREVRVARDHLLEPEVPEETVPYVVHHLGRVSEIMKLMVQQWSVMETLTPQDFLAFRDKLVPASGFQSFQMREIELVLGMDDADRLQYGGVDPVDHILEAAKVSPAGDFVRERIMSAREEPTLRAALHAWLSRTPIQGSQPGEPEDETRTAAFLDAYLDAYRVNQEAMADRLAAASVADTEALRRRVEQTIDAARRFLEAADADPEHRPEQRRARAGLLFVESYRELPLLAWPRTLIDAVVEVEEQFVLWRHRHARMTERTIGRRVGTGGSSGVDYLDEAARGRIFPELWAVRSLLLPREALPPLRDPASYGFAR
jgi:tryptophan 2,3-dioxygenase